MFSGPIRGGTRGGQGDFKWTDVADDKDRENYLGHSILAPVGRWQKNRDITWYNNEKSKEIQSEEDQIEEKRKRKEEEIKAIKLAEEEALSLALGFKPTPRGQIASSSNTTELGNRKQETNEEERFKEKEKRAQEKAEKVARKLARAEKRAIKQEKRFTSKSNLRHSSRSPVRRREDYDHEPRHSRIGSRRRQRSRSLERDSSNRCDRGKRRDQYRSRSRSKSPSISTSRHQYHHQSPSPDSLHPPRRHRSRSIEDDRKLTNSRDRTRR